MEPSITICSLLMIKTLHIQEKRVREWASQCLGNNHNDD